MAQVPIPLVSHTRRVCSLYKRAIRTLAEWYLPDRVEYRYRAVLLRARFDKNKDVVDIRKAKDLLIAGEQELYNQLHYEPFQFVDSPGGLAYEREIPVPDYAVDMWSPEERAAYPEYFKKREQLRKDYEELYYTIYPEARGTRK